MRSRLGAVLCFAFSARSVSAAYEKPPCKDGQVRAVFMDRVICASPCDDGATCSGEKPAGTLADPRCVLKDSRPDFRRNYCALICTANSYCPKGSVCMKPKVGDKDPENPLGDQSPYLLKDDIVPGVCTYKMGQSSKKKKDTVTAKFTTKYMMEFMNSNGIQPPPFMRPEDEL
eukprot:TRINITY_DN83898_c0_g1_i1.p2 TRINITY_DN83898_c0_g1~~TRINITY_DN83898_c0_g1_i1.p2  ORF type:complete len:173 (-),score=39.14 TRINITY_DN83898_c0_g1_i1:135-653(-)